MAYLYIPLGCLGRLFMPRSLRFCESVTGSDKGQSTGSIFQVAKGNSLLPHTPVIRAYSSLLPYTDVRSVARRPVVALVSYSFFRIPKKFKFWIQILDFPGNFEQIDVNLRAAVAVNA